ncbi:MAG: NAD(P)-dependent alcohol dehydrogenase [Myxococcota bacterium]
MRAIVYREYGGPEVLRLAELERPAPARGQVLVQVRASSINSADQRMMRAHPFLVRLANGLFRPKKRLVLGQDVAGVVAAVGEGVTRFAVGDEVFGETPMLSNGAFAEFTLAAEASLAPRPRGLSFEESAAVPLAGTTALQALRDLGRVTEARQVLLVGAGGGVGLFAVQIARLLGAEVTAVCGPRSVELVRALGAHEVIDYTRDDFTARPRTWDTVVAINGYRPLSAYRRALAPGGRFVMVGGTNAQLFKTLLFARPFFALDGKWGGALTLDERKRPADLTQLRAWLEAGRLRVHVDRRYPLTALVDAMTYVEQGHVSGKVVLTTG